MRRRSFLKTVPAILLSPALLSSCQEDPLPGIGKKVIIVGAGLSSIYAGHLLLQKGYEVEILEASDRWGGRIRALEGFADFVIELGAEEVHGQNTAWYKLVKKTPGLQFTNTDDQDYYWMANSLKTETAAKATPDGGKAFAFIDNASNYSGTDVSVQAYADSQGVPASVQYVVNAQIGNEFGTSINRLSMKGVAEEDALWTAGDENLPVANRSYQTVIETHFSDALAKIALNTPVQTIDYSSAKVKAADANGVNYEADYVLVTVPLPVLRDGDIAFLPALPSDKTAAMQKIGMGAGIKMMLKFNERFWAADTGSIIGSGPVPEYWYTAAGRGTTPVLTAFVMGEKAEQLSALGSSAVQTVLADLDVMFGAGVASGKFLDAQIMDWSKMPFVRGAYSFPVVGGGISQREKLAASVAGKVFFAGEATHTKGHSATMHGAFETAERAVAEIVG